MEVSGISGAVRSGDIGFRIGPRINAAGRMDSPNEALELLLTRDRTRAAEIAARLDDWNAQRQRAEALVVDQARELFEGEEELPPLLVAWSPEWHRGVVGIAAGRLSRHFHRPAILLSVEGEHATGSGRSIDGLHLHDFIHPWGGRLERFGGHSQAIGLTASLEAIDALKQEWIHAAGKWDPSLLTRRYVYEEVVPAQQVGDQLLAEIRRLEPFGVGNRRPILRVGPLERLGDIRRFGSDHLSCRARASDGAEIGLLGWRWGDRAAAFNGSFEVLGTVSWDRYLRQTILELVDVRPHTDPA